jgi:hypothetical protein
MYNSGIVSNTVNALLKLDTILKRIRLPTPLGVVYSSWSH